MVKYTINDLEKITGIKAHTLRIWEKRYNVVSPRRTKTNIRYYLDKEVKKLINVSTLRKYGLKISDITKMNDNEINAKVLELSSSLGDHDGLINSLMGSMIELSEENFENIISNSVLKMGFENTVMNLLYPLLEKIGILWQVGSIIPAQEHFISNLIREKIIIAKNAHNTLPKANSKKFLLFLPENELHELGLLFYSYLLKKYGHSLIYIGQSTPFDDLIKIQKIKNADFLLTHLVNATVPYKTCEYINNLSKTFSEKTIFVAGNRVCNELIETPKNVFIIKNTNEFKEMLNHYI